MMAGSNIQFFCGKLSKSYKLSYEAFLFNTEIHRRLQSKIGWREFYLLNVDKKIIFSSVFFNVDKGIAISPLKSPFGSFEISKEVQSKDFYDFLLFIEKILSDEGVKEIRITNPPSLLQDNHSLLMATLSSLGYQITEAAGSAIIEVDRPQLLEKMNTAKQRQVKKSEKAGFAFRIINNNKLKTVYAFIHQCRLTKNQNLSMSYVELNKTIQALPNAFVFCGVYDKRKLIAASVCVRTRKDVLYSFYPAHDAQYDAYSPMTMLLSELYQWCYNHKINFLDLGTSMNNNQINFSLLDYKQRVGGTLTTRLKFHKTL